MRAAGRTHRIAISLLLVVATAAACTGGGSDGPDTSGGGSDKAVDGGTMALGLGGAVQPDPAAANLGSPSDLLVLDLLHDGLTRLGPKGAPAAALALSWKPDASLSTWEFKLDPDATFSNGRAVIASDVVASLERVARGGDSSLAALRLESISGFRAFVDGTAEHLSGLTAPDQATVRIGLDTPMSVLPVILASPLFGVVDITSLEAVRSGVGELADLDLAGDWAMSSAKDDVVILERRDGSKGHLDEVELRSYDSGEAAYDAFDAGDVDWALVPVERYGDAARDHSDAAFAPFHAELFFGMHVASPALGNVELRKAIALAIDRDAIVGAVYPDLAEPLMTVIPGGVPGYDPERCAACGYNPDKAKSILKAAFPDGGIPSVGIDFDESPAQDAMAQLVAHDLEVVGIPSQLRPKPLADYKRFVVSGAQELFSFGWIGGYVSADAYLAPLFGSAANDNLTGYSAASVDAALAAARATTDPATASARWSEVEAQVLADAVVVPIAQFRTQAVVAERVQHFEHAVDGSIDWSGVWVSDGA